MTSNLNINSVEIEKQHSMYSIYVKHRLYFPYEVYYPTEVVRYKLHTTKSAQYDQSQIYLFLGSTIK